MTITYDDENMTGTWETLDPIDFYIVKGGPQYAIWWIEESATSGIWTTEGLLNKGGKRPEISHLSAYNDQYASVPEPATLSLMGVGLLMLAGLIRRKIITVAV